MLVLTPAALRSAAPREVGGTLGLCAAGQRGAVRQALPVLLAAAVFLPCQQFKGELLASYAS